MSPPSAYALDNEADTAWEMLDCLEEILDTSTCSRLYPIGIPRGGRCLELGAGNGSVARMLADMVGPDGTVVAPDLNPRHLNTRDHANIRVLRHDLERDEVPPGSWD